MFTDPIKHHVVFLATSTEEKVRDFNIAAAAKNLPVTFFNLKDLIGTLHNTLENGDSADQNAQEKFTGVSGKVEDCRKDPVAIRNFCFARNISNYAPERVWFATEDSGVTMPREIWENIPKDIFGVLPDEVKQRLHKQESGPGVDTAPFLSATLGSSNIQQIIEAGFNEYARTQDYFLSLRELNERLLFKEESVLKFQSLVPSMQEGTIEGQLIETFPILTAKGETQNSYSHSPYVHPDEVAGRSSNYAVMSPRSRNPRQVTAAEMGANYIAHHSARAKVLDDLVEKINEVTPEKHRLLPTSKETRHEVAHDIAAHPNDFHVGVLNAGKGAVPQELESAIAYEGAHLKLHTHPNHDEPPANASSVDRATYYLSYPERILSQSDGLVLMPDSQCPKDERMTLKEKLYLLQSIVVAKQLITRDKDKPVTIINTDHSWDEAVRIHTALANCQMTKDQALPLSYRFVDANAPEHYTGIKADAVGNSYFHTINRSDYNEALKAASFIIKDKSLAYHRIESKPNKVSKEGEPPQQKGMVAIFCSASCENVPLNRFVSEMTCKLVQAGKKIICGGGDRYTMGAILDGVRQFRALPENKGETIASRKQLGYIAGISTYPIAASETNKGEMPDDYSYRELTSNIYERMAKMMLPAETIVVAPGGAGTIQEWMGFNLLKEKMPSLFNQKKLVIFDPDLMTNPEHAVSVDDVEVSPSSLQNNVFAKVLDVIFGSSANYHRLKGDFNRSGTFIVSKVDGAVATCLSGQSERRLAV